jgi:hypothetical protein
MPSGREAVTPKAWVPETLGEEDLARMRAPPEVGVGDDGGDGESSDDEGNAGASSRAVGGDRDPVGALSGTRNEYRGGDGSSYY